MKKCYTVVRPYSQCALTGILQHALPPTLTIQLIHPEVVLLIITYKPLTVNSEVAANVTDV